MDASSEIGGILSEQAAGQVEALQDSRQKLVNFTRF